MGLLKTLRSEKIHLPRPGLNPQTSDLVESMITTGPMGLLKTLRSEKIHRPRPGLNPRTSDLVASMITTGPMGLLKITGNGKHFLNPLEEDRLSK